MSAAIHVVGAICAAEEKLGDVYTRLEAWASVCEDAAEGEVHLTREMIAKLGESLHAESAVVAAVLRLSLRPARAELIRRSGAP